MMAYEQFLGGSMTDVIPSDAELAAVFETI
jgi:hypothetical protein